MSHREMSLSYSAVATNTVDATRDLQDRVARLARAVLVIVAVMGGGSILTHVGSQGHSSESGGALHEIFHLATLGPAVAAWLRCRGSLMRVSVIELFDSCLTISACVLYAVLGLTASTSLTATFSVVLAMTYTLVGRSIIVPSSFRRTLWISIVGAIPIVLYFAVQRVAAAFEQSPRNGRIFMAFGILWCVLAVLAAAANSRQLYGLRAQLREIGRLGQYTLEEKIGEGAMGTVYRATHAMLRRPAAIKLLAKNRTSGLDPIPWTPHERRIPWLVWQIGPGKRGRGVASRMSSRTGRCGWCWTRARASRRWVATST